MKANVKERAEGFASSMNDEQKRAIRMVSGLGSAEYEDRLYELGMTSLEERRHQADMQYMYKILTGRQDVDRGEWFTMALEASRATRSTAHNLNVRVKQGRGNPRLAWANQGSLRIF